MIYCIVSIVVCIIVLARVAYTESFLDGSYFDFTDTQDRALIIIMASMMGAFWPLTFAYLAINCMLSAIIYGIEEFKKRKQSNDE